jgi:hypothetical protein
MAQNNAPASGRRTGQGECSLVLRSCLAGRICSSGEERLLSLVEDIGMQERWGCLFGVPLGGMVEMLNADSSWCEY